MLFWAALQSGFWPFWADLLRSGTGAEHYFLILDGDSDLGGERIIEIGALFLDLWASEVGVGRLGIGSCAH